MAVWRQLGFKIARFLDFEGLGKSSQVADGPPACLSQPWQRGAGQSQSCLDLLVLPVMGTPKVPFSFSNASSSTLYTGQRLNGSEFRYWRSFKACELVLSPADSSDVSSTSSLTSSLTSSSRQYRAAMRERTRTPRLSESKVKLNLNRKTSKR